MESDDLRTEMKGEFREVRSEINDLRTEFRAEFQNVRTEMASQFQEVWSEFERVRGEIKTEGETTRRYMAMVDENFRQYVKVLAEGIGVNTERLDNHEWRISAIERIVP